MNIKSCDNCGVVVDIDKLHSGDLYSKETGEVNLEYYEWDGEEFVPIFECPVCNFRMG